MKTKTLLASCFVLLASAGLLLIAACGDDLAPITPAGCTDDVCRPDDVHSSPSPGDDDAGGEPCNAPADNPAGCRCTILNTRRVCFNGAHGVKSVCNQAGLQTCVVGSDGKARWSDCADASAPAAAETCFNDLDDDCDGKVDFGCACSEFVDMCTSPDGGAMYPKNQYTFVTVPSAPKAGAAFDLFVLTYDLSLPSGSHLARPGYCYGGATSRPCPNPGPNCVGWKVAVFNGVIAPAGDIPFDIKRPDDPPCPSGPNDTVTTKSIRIAP